MKKTPTTMELQNPFREFYDSYSESLNESNFFTDRKDSFNFAFIESPDESYSWLLENSSISDSARKPVHRDEKEDQKILSNCMQNKPSEKNDRSDLSCEGNRKKTLAESSLKGDLKQYSAATSACLDEETSAKGELKPRYLEEIGKIQISEISMDANFSKLNEDKPNCIFSSTYQDGFEQAPKEYDWNKMVKRSFFELEDENKEAVPKIRNPFSRPDYQYHELSTIYEMDSMFMDESAELSMHPKVLKTNGSLDFTIRPKTSINSLDIVMKVIQNRHLKKLLQEPGILEEPELTLISTDFDSVSKVSDVSLEKSLRHSDYQIKRFKGDESPSLISFLQHEFNCMNECIDD